MLHLRRFPVAVAKVVQKDVPIFDESIGTTVGFVNADVLSVVQSSGNSAYNAKHHLTNREDNRDVRPSL